DRDALGADGVGRVDVLGRVADDDDAASLERRAEAIGAALGADAEELGAKLVIAAEAAEGEAAIEVDVRELELGAAADVAGAEADRAALELLRGVERFADPRVDAPRRGGRRVRDPGRRSFAELAREELEVEIE